jgi:hypothetical protein
MSKRGADAIAEDILGHEPLRRPEPRDEFTAKIGLLVDGKLAAMHNDFDWLIGYAEAILATQLQSRLPTSRLQIIELDPLKLVTLACQNTGYSQLDLISAEFVSAFPGGHGTYKGRFKITYPSPEDDSPETGYVYIWRDQKADVIVGDF